MVDYLTELIALMQADIEKKSKLTDNESRQEVAYLNIELLSHKTNLETKKKALAEYDRICSNEEKIKEMEQKDFHANWPDVFMKALQFKDDTSLPLELLNHLREVLSLKTDHFDLEQKVAYFLALKKEVQMCQNWKEFNKKQNVLIVT